MDASPGPTHAPRWWLLVAAFPAVVIVGALVSISALALATTDHLVGVSEPQIAVGVTVPALATVLLLPYALYRDITALQASIPAERWDPQPHRYVIPALAGVFVPLVGVGVAAAYLYRRHDRVGVP